MSGNEAKLWETDASLHYADRMKALDWFKPIEALEVEQLTREADPT